MKRVTLTLVPLLFAITATQPRTQILPEGTYRYDVTIGGNSVGTSTIVIRHAGGVIAIGESASVAGATLVSNRKIDEASFATLAYTVDFGHKHAAVAVLGNAATVIQDGVSTKFSAPPDAPFVVGDNRVAGFAVMPATLHGTGAKKLTLACVCGGGFMVIPVIVASNRDGVVTTSIEGTSVVLHYDPRTYVLGRADVPSQEASMILRSYDQHPTALPQPIVPTPVPLPPARYTSRDVSVTADDGVTLAGTLTIPSAAARPLPRFVFVHGSGCIDRDETIGPNKIFAQLANRLSNDGYAVLRYDKRSCGKSGGAFATRNRLIADARAVIAYLRAQPGIDPRRIFVFGHSEGGELAPSIAIADGRLAGIVLLAPPALGLDQIIMQQTLRTATAANRATIERKEHAELDAIASGKKAGSYNDWLRSSFGIDPAALIAKVPCPILILQGGKDIQVLAGDTPRLVNAARAANRRVTLVMLPNDDHLFIELAPGATSSGGEYFTPAYLDPALFTAIESWLNVKP